MKNFMSKHSPCAHIAIQLDMVRCSASIYEACYILPHAEMKRGGLKVLHGHKDTGGEKWKHWTCFMQLERVWSADNVNLICMPFTLVWWYHLVHLIQLNWFADIWFWPQTKDIPGNLQLESDAVGKNCTYLIGLIQGTWLLSDMFSEWFGSPH